MLNTSESIMPSQNPYPLNHYLPYDRQPKISSVTYLIETIETEEKYVEDLRYLLQQVTRCWDHDNPLPPELNVVFSILDDIYHYNNNFHSRLKQIGTDPKELSDVLMTWVEEMEGPYAAYCQNFRRKVDLWPEIENNLNLQDTLSTISGYRNQPVTLDSLFEMPLKRIYYYKKLYMRILKSSEPGRSDHDTLTTANKRLDNLVELEKKAKMTNKPREIPRETPRETPREIPRETPRETPREIPREAPRETPRKTPREIPREAPREISREIPRETPRDTRDSLPMPQIVENTYISPVNMTIPDIDSPKTVNLTLSDIDSPKTVNLTLSEVESQLDTSRVVNLYTKQPKTFQLQLSPPHLPFKREIILHDDFIIILEDEKKSNHRAHVNAHLILCTDLLLICKQLTAEEIELNPTKNWWLLYPPLSARNITIGGLHDNKEELFNMVVSTASGRQSMVIVANYKNIKETWIKNLTQAIEFSKAASANPPSSPTRPQLSISVQEGNSSTGNFLTVDSARNPSPPGNLLSPTLKVGLPSSPRSPRSNSPTSNAPSLRSRSRSRSPADQSRNNLTPPNSGGYLQISENQRSHVKSLDSISSVSSISSSVASFTETIYQTPPCEVSCWVVGEWVPLSKKEQCIVEIKMASSNKPCWTVTLESSGRMILNGWIHSKTSLQRESSFCISIPVEMGQDKECKEYYRIASANQRDSDILYSHFLKVKNQLNNELGVPSIQGFSRSSSLNNNQSREIEQALQDVMQCKVKLFLQNNHGVWTNLGWGNMKLLLETPSLRKRVIIYSDKQKSKILVDTFITEYQRMNRNITFKINNVGTAPFIYMMQMKDEANASKAIEILRS